MTFEFTEAEIDIIKHWYHAAAGESVSCYEDPAFKGLIAKFGFELHHQDNYMLEHGS